MARPWISLLLLSLVLVAIDAENTKYEECPAKTVCLLWTHESCNGHSRSQPFDEGTATGYFWGEGSECEELDEYKKKKIHTFTASLWMAPLSARKWNITARLLKSVHKDKDTTDEGRLNTFDETTYEFDFGNVKISWIKNEANTDSLGFFLMQFSWKKTEDSEWSSSTYPTKFNNKFHNHRPFDKNLFGIEYGRQRDYPGYTSVVESAEKLGTLFGDVTVIKSMGSGNVIDNDVPKFNKRLHELTSELCDPSELLSFEFDNADNGTLPMKKDEKGAVDCPETSTLRYRKPGGEWEPLDSMECKDGAWLGKYSRPIVTTEAPMEETATGNEEEDGEDDDDPNAHSLRAARAVDNEESTEETKPEEYDLTGKDVVCRPPEGDSVGMTGFQKGAMGVGIAFVVLAIVALIIGAVIFVLRRKKAAAGPYDTFRAGSESKAQTPKGGSMSKKSGSVAEFGGMSPAGIPNAPK